MQDGGLDLFLSRALSADIGNTDSFCSIVFTDYLDQINCKALHEWVEEGGDESGEEDRAVDEGWDQGGANELDKKLIHPRPLHLQSQFQFHFRSAYFFPRCS